MFIRLSLIAFLFTAVPAVPRQWTDTKGRTVEGEFVSQTADKVTLKLATGKAVTLEKAKLCDADQEFLKTAAAPASPSAAVPGARGASFTGGTFDSVKIDRGKWVRPAPPRDFKIKGVAFGSQIETAHFLIAGTTAVKPALLEVNAEACERLYSHMVRLLPQLEETFRERRMAVWVVANREEMTTFDNWVDSFSDGDFSGNENTVNAAVTLPKSFAGEFKFMPGGRLLRADGAESQRGLKWPSRLFFVSSTAMHSALRPMKYDEEWNFGLIELGWSYFLEGEICNNITTEVSFADSGSSVEGFKNGRTWPATIKGILKNGSTKPGVALLLGTKKSKSQPIHVGISYGFSHWCFREPVRARQFNDLLAAGIKDGLAPDAGAFAKAFGYASVDAFDAAFAAYLQSDRFK